MVVISKFPEISFASHIYVILFLMNGWAFYVEYKRPPLHKFNFRGIPRFNDSTKDKQGLALYADLNELISSLFIF